MAEPRPWWESTSVRPAKTVQEYVREIDTYRDPALKVLKVLIDEEEYDKISNALIVSPFSNVQQACFYLPWALLPIDEDLSYRVQLKYLQVKSNIDDLDQTAQEANNLYQDQEAVNEAFMKLEMSLNEFLQMLS